MDTPTPDAPPAMTPKQAAIGVVLIMTGVAAYLGAAFGLGIGPYYMGFLFSLYFGAFERMDAKMFVPAIVGSLAGIANAAALSLLPVLLGNGLGLSLALAITLACTFCLLMGWLRIAINGGYMLFLTVATIPALQKPQPFLGMAAAVLLGTAFMAALLGIGGLIARRKAAAA